jgi:hypothetical protein
MITQQCFSSFDLAHGMRNEVEGGERGPLLSRISVYSQH